MAVGTLVVFVKTRALMIALDGVTLDLICYCGFFRYERGEGIEKRQENFAEEVAKQAGH